MDLNALLSYQILGNTVVNYAISFTVFLFSIISLKIFEKIIVRQIKNLTRKTKNKFDDLIVRWIESIGWSVYFVAALLVSVQFITTPPVLGEILGSVLFILLAYQSARMIDSLISYAYRKLSKDQDKEEVDSSIIDFLSKISKGLLWAVVILMIVQNLGYDVSTLIAGLGVGGIAIAFALQSVLSDIFASLSIFFDKPFKTGDFIIVGNEMGVVERIGIKSTRIKALQGEEIIIANKELTESRVHNYKRMRRRRVAFSLGVTYDTPAKKLKKIPELVRNVFEKIEKVKLDRVHFNSFNDSNLGFEIVYYVESGDYNKYMDVQQEINLGIVEALEKKKIEIAFPTQTVFLKK